MIRPPPRSNPFPYPTLFRSYALLAHAWKPAVVVMQDVGPDRPHSCHAGEIMATTMKQLGAVGILTDGGLRDAREVAALRSEEHTSELQSRQYLVCRLLLEKK